MTNPTTLTAPGGQPFVDIEREFDAPLDAVYAAWTDPELVARWLGPHGYDMRIAEWEVRDGGRWRYVHLDGEAEYGFHGVFHTIRPGELIIQTFEFEGYPDSVAIETIRFEDLGDGRTRTSGRSVYPTLEARDGMVDSGMERGVVEGYERLDSLLAGVPAA